MGRKSNETSLEIRKMIISLHEKGKSSQEISNIVTRSRSTIQYIIVKRYKTENRIENKPRNLNRRLSDDRDERKILKEIKLNPKISAPKLVVNLETDKGKKVHAETIRRTIKKTWV